MSEPDPSLLIEDIIDSAKKILNYTKNLSLMILATTAKRSMRSSEILKLLEKQQIVCRRALKTNILLLTGIGFADLETGLFIIISELIILSFGRSKNLFCPS